MTKKKIIKETDGDDELKMRRTHGKAHVDATRHPVKKRNQVGLTWKAFQGLIPLNQVQLQKRLILTSPPSWFDSKERKCSEEAKPLFAPLQVSRGHYKKFFLFPL